MQLKGKYAIITGANRGIGRAITEKFAAEGACIWACARKCTQEFEEDMKLLSKQYGVFIQPVYFDLKSEQEIVSGIKQILAKKKPIDILVNNAGIAASGLLTMTPVSVLKDVFEVNFFAQVFLMQLVAKKMIRQKNGCIINMVSVGGIEHRQGYLAYGSSKAALIWTTRMAAKELGIYGIRVNGIAPATVDTDMGHYRNEEELKKVIEDTPLGRLAKSAEIAEAAVFLASPKASFITGDILKVDGGRA